MSLSKAALDAYFERIGYGGPTSVEVETLHGIALRHVSTVPFENLDVLRGLGISLDPDRIFQKLVTDRRGGYCFEQNALLLSVLESLGFEVRPLSGRVRLQRARDFTPPRTHMFVRAELDGQSWLVDVGVGGLSPTAALRLELESVQETPHEARRFILVGGRWFHQARLGADWADVCEFTLEEMPPIDREVGNWYTSTHPNSSFQSRLLVARAGPSGTRVTVLNREFSVRDAAGQAHTTVLADPDALLAVLAEHFGLEFPGGTRFRCSGLDWP